MTCGELAQMINGEGWIRNRCKLTVVPMNGWRRSMVWRDTGLYWTPTSPNVPRGNSPIYYAATGLFGELAGGSGATIGTRLRRPFECVIAPWLNANKFSAAMTSYGLRGIGFPTFTVIHEGQRLQGVSLKIIDPVHSPLVAINFYLLDAIEKASGRDLFAEAVQRKKDFQMFDKVCGTDEVRRQLKTGKSASEIVESWRAGEETFRQRRRNYLLYGDPASVQPVPATGSKPVPAAESKRVLVAESKQAPIVDSTLIWLPTSTNSRAALLTPLFITVSKGDTAEKIAQDLGVTVSDLAEANPGTNVSRLKVGQKLKVPRPEPK
jgi:LysM repeat protein